MKRDLNPQSQHPSDQDLRLGARGHWDLQDDNKWRNLLCLCKGKWQWRAHDSVWHIMSS